MSGFPAPCTCNQADCQWKRCRVAATDARYQRLRGLEVTAPEPAVPIAPLNGWKGKSRPPWTYPVTICMAHIETLDLLELSLALWECQTVKPYVLVIDTGSSWDTVQRMEGLRRPNVEIHYLRGHSYANSSEPVSFALDVAHARCWTTHLLHTHVDVFPKRRDLLEWFLGQCNAETPVVGYEMSNRSWSTDRWRGLPSHTCTMLHMPTIDTLGARWSLRLYYQREGWPENGTTGWPDTESVFGEHLKKTGLPMKLLGPEPNYTLQETVWFSHARSYTGLKLAPDNRLWPRAQEYTRKAVEAAGQRLRAWQKFPNTRPCQGCGKPVVGV